MYADVRTDPEKILKTNPLKSPKENRPHLEIHQKFLMNFRNFSDFLWYFCFVPNNIVISGLTSVPANPEKQF